MRAAIALVFVLVACGSRTLPGPPGKPVSVCRSCALCVMSACTQVEQIVAAGKHTCVRLSQGRVMCWGSNEAGILGNGTTDTSAHPEPTEIALGEEAKEISVSDTHACAVLASGNVSCWGSNDTLALGRAKSAAGAPKIVPVVHDATHVGAGHGFSCASNRNSVWCWGAGSSGQLGDGTPHAPVSDPVLTSIQDPIASFALGLSHGCAVTEKNELWCWGSNTQGQLGIGTNSPLFPPVKVSPLDWVEQAVIWGAQTCAVPLDGVPSCWGGTLPPFPNRLRYAPDVKSIAASDVTQCTIATNGAVRCGAISSGGWGAPEFQGKTVTGAATQITTGTAHGCAVLESGAVACWGMNDHGELGDGTTDDRANPGNVVWP